MNFSNHTNNGNMTSLVNSDVLTSHTHSEKIRTKKMYVRESLSVTGLSTFFGDINVTGTSSTSTFSGSLNVSGVTTLNNVVTCGSTLNVSSMSTLAGGLVLPFVGVPDGSSVGQLGEIRLTSTGLFVCTSATTGWSPLYFNQLVVPT